MENKSTDTRWKLAESKHFSTASFHLAYVEMKGREKPRVQLRANRLFYMLKLKKGNKTIAQLVQPGQLTCFPFCSSFRFRAHFVSCLARSALFFFSTRRRGVQSCINITKRMQKKVVNESTQDDIRNQKSTASPVLLRVLTSVAQCVACRAHVLLDEHTASKHSNRQAFG